MLQNTQFRGQNDLLIRAILALLHSVPRGKMIVLDLFADVKPIWKSSSQFYGTPYIWCMLHNFGGNIEMYGVLDAVASGPIDARTSENSTMVKFLSFHKTYFFFFFFLSEVIIRKFKLFMILNPSYTIMM
nr:alpha-N-acetylglucosaminidase-like isoform X2 [Nicotiana tomentosiformis]